LQFGHKNEVSLTNFSLKKIILADEVKWINANIDLFTGGLKKLIIT